MAQLIFEAPTGLYASHHGYYPCKDQSLDNKNLQEMVEVNWDSDTAPGQGLYIPKYVVKEVDLPSITTTIDDYINNYIQVEDFYRYCYKLRDIPIEYLKRLFQLKQADQPQFFMCVKLLEVKNFRSAFRMSLHSQLIKWLKHESEYESPFSWKQVHAFMGESHTSFEYSQWTRARVRYGIPCESIKC